MASPPTPERVEFVEYVLAGGTGTCVGVFQAMLAQLSDTGVVLGSIRVSMVRRMTTLEAARLELQPVSGAWFEIRGNLLRAPAPKQASCRMAVQRRARSGGRWQPTHSRTRGER